MKRQRSRDSQERDRRHAPPDHDDIPKPRERDPPGKWTCILCLEMYTGTLAVHDRHILYECRQRGEDAGVSSCRCGNCFAWHSNKCRLETPRRPEDVLAEQWKVVPGKALRLDPDGRHKIAKVAYLMTQNALVYPLPEELEGQDLFKQGCTPHNATKEDLIAVPKLAYRSDSGEVGFIKGCMGKDSDIVSYVPVSWGAKKTPLEASEIYHRSVSEYNAAGKPAEAVKG